MFWRLRFRFSRHTVEPLVEKSPQRPTRAIARQHIKIVNMKIRDAMRFANFGRIHMGQPVIGDNLARNVENQSAQRVTLIGVGIHAPVELLQIFID